VAYNKCSPSQNDYTDKGESGRKQLLLYNRGKNMLHRAALQKATYLLFFFYKVEKLFKGTVASQPSLHRYWWLFWMPNAPRILGFVSPY